MLKTSKKKLSVQATDLAVIFSFDSPKAFIWKYVPYASLSNYNVYLTFVIFGIWMPVKLFNEVIVFILREMRENGFKRRNQIIRQKK